MISVLVVERCVCLGHLWVKEWKLLNWTISFSVILSPVFASLSTGSCGLWGFWFCLSIERCMSFSNFRIKEWLFLFWSISFCIILGPVRISVRFWLSLSIESSVSLGYLWVKERKLLNWTISFSVILSPSFEAFATSSSGLRSFWISLS